MAKSKHNKSSINRAHSVKNTSPGEQKNSASKAKQLASAVLKNKLCLNIVHSANVHHCLVKKGSTAMTLLS